MSDRWHVEWLREGVIKWNKRRKTVKFKPDLSGVNFYELLPPDFRDSPKTSRYFEKIDLSDANLRGANLSNLNFHKAKFTGANLEAADLSKSNFGDAKFIRCNLSKVNFFRSTLAEAVFENSDLSGAKFDETNLTNAGFVKVVIDARQEKLLGEYDLSVFESRAALNEDRESRLSSGIELGEIRPDISFRAEVQIDVRTYKNRYDVYYGTNRVPIVERGAVTGFGSERAGEISYGLCEVFVPDGHQVGSLGSPLWKRLLNRKDDRLRVDSLISLNRDLYFEKLKQSLISMKDKERPTVFVHGFNNSFEDATLRAAQIGYDLGLGQGIGLFSWPSRGELKKYSADEATIEASKYHLADFIEQYIQYAEGDAINLIAHSMGCRCLLLAFEVLAIDRKHVLEQINQVILAAADVDVSSMDRLGAYAISNSARTTSYVSGKDKALMLSEWLHDFPRVGLRPPTYVMENMDTVIVDGKDLGDWIGHGYVSSSRTFLNDIFALLKNGAHPKDRFAMERYVIDKVTCWRLKE